MKQFEFTKTAESLIKEAIHLKTADNTIPALQTAAGGLALGASIAAIRKGNITPLSLLAGGLGLGMATSGLSGIFRSKAYVDFVNAHAENKAGTGLRGNKVNYKDPQMKRMYKEYTLGTYQPPFSVAPLARG